MKERLKLMDHNKFVECTNALANSIEKFLNDNNLKIDYVVPVLRSGAVPGVYIANKLNIVKFAPIQVKHIKYNSGEEKVEMLYSPFKTAKITKKEPVFLIVEGTQFSGTSIELCINEIYKQFPKAKILYVCITKYYGSKSFADKVLFEKAAIISEWVNLSEEECKKNGIESHAPVYPWEIIENEITHPDDLEDNIFF